jgi:hypothetical protein
LLVSSVCVAGSQPDRQRRLLCSKCQRDRVGQNASFEGFLLHLRNLIAFFTSNRQEDSDLILNDTKQWAGEDIDVHKFSDLGKTVRELNKKHGAYNDSCYGQISKYLQHCTTYRREREKEWDIDAMFRHFDPIFAEFIKRFAIKKA